MRVDRSRQPASKERTQQLRDARTYKHSILTLTIGPRIGKGVYWDLRELPASPKPSPIHSLPLMTEVVQ